MYTARRKVLTMLKDGKVSVADAEEMLDAIAPQRRVGEAIPKVEIVGESEAVIQLRARIQEVARTDSPVLIYGEPGTGKALIARGIHAASRRAGHPFVAYSCADSVNANDAEIFGVENGGPGGDIKRGMLEMAQGGALFLDWGSVMLPETQYRLHSYLTDGYFTRVNGVQPVYADVRIMVATNQDVGAEVEAGRFRADLYDALRVCLVEPRALRDTPEDLPVLAAYFVEKRAERDGRPTPEIAEAVLDRLRQYEWPRNVAELARVIDEAMVHCEGDALRVEHLPELGA